MRYRDNLPLVSANLIRMIYMVGVAVVLQLYLRNELGASRFTVSLLTSIFWLGLLLFAPLWGALSDSSGRRGLVLAMSMLATGLIIPVFGLLTGTMQVLGLRFVFAVFAAAFPPVALAAMSHDSARERRGRDVAPYHTSRALGFLLGWGGFGLVLDLLGFQYTFIVFGIVGLLGFIATTRITGIDTPEDVSIGEVWRNAKQRWVPSRTDQLFHENGLNYLYAAIFLRKMGLIGMFSLIAIYADNVLGFTASLIGILLALNPAAQLLFIDFFGSLVDRGGRRNVFLFGFLATIPVPFLLAVTQSPVLFGITYLLIGFSFAALIEGSTTFIGDIAPASRQGELMGFRKSAQGLAGVIGPILAGAVATLYGYTAMFIMMGGIISLGFLLAWQGTEETLEPSNQATIRAARHIITEMLHR